MWISGVWEVGCPRNGQVLWTGGQVDRWTGGQVDRWTGGQAGGGGAGCGDFLSFYAK